MSEQTGIMPKRTLLMWLVGLCCLMESAGCVPTTRQDVVADYNTNPLTVSLPSKISAQETEEAMVRTFIGRNWQIQQRSPRQVVGTLNHRDCEGKAILKVEGDVIKILNETTCDSKPAVRVNWLENLQKDLTKHLSQATFQ